MRVQGVGKECGAHIASFVRGASRDQVHALFEEVGVAVEERLQEVSPLWVSTSGMGVFWVHVRLDTRPKYYTYVPYKSAPRT